MQWGHQVRLIRILDFGQTGRLIIINVRPGKRDIPVQMFDARDVNIERGQEHCVMQAVPLHDKNA